MQTLTFGDMILKEVPCSVCIGVFDGIHLGHKAIIQRCVEEAQKKGCKSMVVSFSVNPKMASKTQASEKALTSAKQMAHLLVNIGVDYHCIIDFSEDMSRLSGEEFIAKLCTLCIVKALVVGSSFRCGEPAHSAGPVQLRSLLSRFSASAELIVVPSVLYKGQVISSSLIRKCLLTGDSGNIPGMLGRPYCIDLSAVPHESEQLRLLFEVRALGQLLPPQGVYKVLTGADEAMGVCAMAEITESYLTLTLPVRIKVDRIDFFQQE